MWCSVYRSGKRTFLYTHHWRFLVYALLTSIYIHSLCWRARWSLLAHGANTRARLSNSFALAFRRATAMWRRPLAGCCGFCHGTIFSTLQLLCSSQLLILNTWTPSMPSFNAPAALSSLKILLTWPNRRYDYPSFLLHISSYNIYHIRF